MSSVNARTGLCHSYQELRKYFERYRKTHNKYEPHQKLELSKAIEKLEKKLERSNIAYFPLL